MKMADGKDGWILHGNLLFSELLEAYDSDETGPIVGLGATKGCEGKFEEAVETLSDCPASGCALASEGEAGGAASNRIKRRKINMSGRVAVPVVSHPDRVRALPRRPLEFPWESKCRQ